MTKSKNSTEVAKASLTLTQADVPAQIDLLKKQLQEIQGDGKTKISTDVSYKGSKINKVSTVKELLEISASIHARAKAFEEETARYKMEGKLDKFQTEGHTPEQWKLIIEKAIFDKVNSVQISNIKKAISELEEFLSDEAKLQNKLSQIVNMANQKIA